MWPSSFVNSRRLSVWLVTPRMRLWTAPYKVEWLPVWLVKPPSRRMAEAAAILRDGGFTNQTGSHSTLYGAVHKRIRGVTSQTLNLREFTKLDGHIRRLVGEAIEKVAGKNEVDLLHEVNYEL